MSGEAAEKQGSEDDRLDLDGGDRETDAKSALGVYGVPGGYFDEETGELHQTVMVRELDGEDEDLLGNGAVLETRRVGILLQNCTLQIGTIRDPVKLAKAVVSLPLADRMALLVAIRMETHGPHYDMLVKCPFVGPELKRPCGKEDEQTVSLDELKKQSMPEPRRRVYDFKGRRSGRSYKWGVATGEFEDAMSVVSRMNDADMLSYTLAVRMREIDGESVRLHPEDVYDAANNKLKLSARGQKVLALVKKMSASDRDGLREAFNTYEPWVETALELQCPHCKREWEGSLDVMQPGFFFPSATRKRLKTR